MFSFLKSQKGITRLMTIVVSMVSITMVGGIAGAVFHFGTTSNEQASKQINSALSEIGGALTLRGNALAYNTPLNNNHSIGKIEVPVVTNGSPIDLTPTYILGPDKGLIPNEDSLSPVQISYSDKSIDIPECAWTVAFKGENNGDYILDNDEKAIITIWLHNYNGHTWDAGSDPFIGSTNVIGQYTFNLLMTPGKGVPLNLEFTTPSLLKLVNVLN